MTEENDDLNDVQMTGDMAMPPLVGAANARDAGVPEFHFDENSWDSGGLSVDKIKTLAGNNTRPRMAGQSTSEPINFAPDNNAMKKILMNIDEAVDCNLTDQDFIDSKSDVKHTVTQLLTESPAAKPIRKSIIAADYDSKEWQIELDEDINGKSIYNVINDRASKCFFEGLYLQQTAKNLCRLLENGSPINSKEINTVLYYEELYRKNYDEARTFRTRHKQAKRAGQRQKANIIESKFHKAKDNAKQAAHDQKCFLKS